MSIMDKFYGMARNSYKTIVLPEGNDDRIIRAAEMIHREKLARVIVLGKPRDILARAGQLGVSLEGVELIQPANYDKLDDFANEYYLLRKDKGIDLDKAREQMLDGFYFGAMMVRLGLADGMVAGCDNPTAKTIVSSVRVVGTQPGVKTLSSFFMMVLPTKEFGADGVLFYADGAVIPNPDAKTLAEIAITTARSFKKLIEVEPYVAMLSFSTKGSGKDPIADKVIEATEIARQAAPDLAIDGELQADAALIMSVGAKKCPASPVAGKANVLIFPDLNAGNIAYKLTQRLAKAAAIGPIFQGLNKPVNDLSRGASIQDIFDVTAITAVQAS